MRILVGHASWQGSTAEIARRIAAALDRAGATVEVAPLGNVEDVAGYDAVVLGSAVHDQSWKPEAVDFVHRRARALRPFRAFGGRFGDCRDWSAIEAWAGQIAQELDARPVAEGA